MFLKQFTDSNVSKQWKQSVLNKVGDATPFEHVDGKSTEKIYKFQDMTKSDKFQKSFYNFHIFTMLMGKQMKWLGEVMWLEDDLLEMEVFWISFNSPGRHVRMNRYFIKFDVDKFEVWDPDLDESVDINLGVCEKFTEYFKRCVKENMEL